MDSDSLRVVENNEIIDHVTAVHEIVKRKCARCGGGMNGCMGCLFDSLAREMIPAALDRILDLMNNVPNDRHDLVAMARENHRQREAKWRKIIAGNGGCEGADPASI